MIFPLQMWLLATGVQRTCDQTMKAFKGPLTRSSTSGSSSTCSSLFLVEYATPVAVSAESTPLVTSIPTASYLEDVITATQSSKSAQVVFQRTVVTKRETVMEEATKVDLRLPELARSRCDQLADNGHSSFLASKSVGSFLCSSCGRQLAPVVQLAVSASSVSTAALIQQAAGRRLARQFHQLCRLNCPHGGALPNRQQQPVGRI